MNIPTRKFGKTYKDTEWIEAEIQEVNRNIIVINKYINEYSYLKLKCLKCNHQWEDSFIHLKNNSYKCPKCVEVLNKIINKNENEFLKKLKSVNSETVLVGKFMNKTSVTIFKCNKHKRKWKDTPENVLNMRGKCPKCIEELKNKPRTILTKANIGDRATGLNNIVSIKKALKSLYPNLKVLEEEYFGEDVPMLVECSKCGLQWVGTVKELVSDSRCPNCNI